MFSSRLLAILVYARVAEGDCLAGSLLNKSLQPRRSESSVMPIRPQFSDTCRVLFESADAVTAVSISSIYDGCFAYGSSQGRVAVWPPSSRFAAPYQSERLQGEIIVITWPLKAARRRGRQASYAVDLAAGDSKGWMALVGLEALVPAPRGSYHILSCFREGEDSGVASALFRQAWRLCLSAPAHLLPAANQP